MIIMVKVYSIIIVSALLDLICPLFICKFHELDVEMIDLGYIKIANYEVF